MDYIVKHSSSFMKAVSYQLFSNCSMQGIVLGVVGLKGECDIVLAHKQLTAEMC